MRFFVCIFYFQNKYFSTTFDPRVFINTEIGTLLGVDWSSSLEDLLSIKYLFKSVFTIQRYLIKVKRSSDENITYRIFDRVVAESGAL